MMKQLTLLILCASMLGAQVKITQEAERVRVEIDGKPFTDFVLGGGEAMKPYLHPLRSPSGKIVTRRFPMEKVDGEPTDHPHQRGLWFAHEKVNGFDFWNNETSYKTTTRGTIKAGKTTVKSGKKGTITSAMTWSGPDGLKLLDEARVMTFSAPKGLRVIDFDITLTAATKVTFGDAKDGLFGIRVAPSMQEVANTGRGITDQGPHTGVITNADGLRTEKALWGKASDWVDYAGDVEGEKVGIAIFDHPSNSPRTRWHARGYGLFAANPFGQTAFGDKGKDGSVVLEPGGKLRLRYRVAIHGADTGAAELAKIWTAYSAGK